MKINTAFGLGQLVFVITPNGIKDTKILPCPACEEEKVIVGKNKQKIPCPKCEGSGKVQNHSYIYGIQQRKISDIVVRNRIVNCQGILEEKKILELVYLTQLPRLHSRMEEYREEDIFLTRGEANAELKRRS